MARESEKTLKIMTESERKIIESGYGIDIGCGDSPISPTCKRFDVEDGDANDITKYVSEKFDYVFSSHCLEHMFEPRKTILDWWSLVKPGGVMFILVPDEDLYEQGFFPSIFNPDHKWTFTISKRHSWSPKSINVMDLVKSLPDVESSQIELQDQGYDREIQSFNRHFEPVRIIHSFRYRILEKLLHKTNNQKDRFCSHFYAIDQTASDALAQIMFKVTKKKI